MDWSRAKTYLILTFLFLNMLLGYQYYIARQQVAGYVQSYSTQLQELKDILKEHKIVLQTDVPKETPVMRFLQVSHPKQTGAEVASHLLKNGKLASEQQGTEKYHSAQGDLTITAGSYYAMQYQTPIPLEGNVSQPKFPATVLQKIGDTVWNSGDFHEDTISQTGNQTVLHYLQTYQNYPVFSSSLEVYLQNSQIIGYNQKALDIGSEEQNGQQVLSAISAVRSITDTIDPKAVSQQPSTVAIRDIKLGYYSPNYDDADVWYLAPMWRILIGQNLYYVNAFTGQVENGSS